MAVSPKLVMPRPIAGPSDVAAGGRGAREQFSLALNDLGREPQIGFAADAFEVVDQHRLAVGRRLDTRTLRGMMVS